MRSGKMALVTALALVTMGPAAAQNNWAAFGQDPGATKFSTLTQINVENVKNLKRAWTFHTGDTSGFFESGLIVIDGVMYFSAPNGVYALDAATGQQIWKYETTGTARRGPHYWPGGNGVGPRIFSQTANGMAAIDPKTGTIITSFGDKGFVTGLRMSSPPVAYKNTLVTQGGNSTVKAWDAVTGEMRWVLNLKAQPGDPNASTWLGDSLKTAGGPGLWGYFSVDVERGLIFVPVEKVGNDYYGGPHHGNNLYSDCLLAVDANTGLESRGRCQGRARDVRRHGAWPETQSPRQSPRRHCHRPSGICGAPRPPVEIHAVSDASRAHPERPATGAAGRWIPGHRRGLEQKRRRAAVSHHGSRHVHYAERPRHHGVRSSRGARRQDGVS